MDSTQSRNGRWSVCESEVINCFMFLQDQDLQSNVSIADLQARLAEIESFTTVLFADIDDSELICI